MPTGVGFATPEQYNAVIDELRDAILAEFEKDSQLVHSETMEDFRANAKRFKFANHTGPSKAQQQAALHEAKIMWWKTLSNGKKPSTNRRKT